MASPVLTLQSLHVDLDAPQPIIDQLDLSLVDGEIGCLLGPSGCGKTTLLRTIAGLCDLQGGRIEVNGRCAASAERSLPPEQRGIGMVFQDLALFPHLNLEDNLCFGIQHWSRKQRLARMAHLLELCDLTPLQGRYPHQLSGGQQQRLALARAMAPQPKLLLLDEPFSSQDAGHREQLARSVRAILHEDGMSALMVTHDQLEAFAMADRIGVMRDGQLLQWGSAYDVYHTPSSRFVAAFVGDGVLIPATVDGGCSVRTDFGTIVGQLSQDLPRDTPVELLLRPDDIQHDDDSPYLGQVIGRHFRGSEHMYRIELPSGTQVLCAAPSHHNHPVGEPIGLRLDLAHLVIFSHVPSTSASGRPLSAASPPRHAPH